MRHFPNHPIDQIEFSFREIWEERRRLSEKWFKTKADKRALIVLEEGMVSLMTRKKDEQT